MLPVLMIVPYPIKTNIYNQNFETALQKSTPSTRTAHAQQISDLFTLACLGTVCGRLH